MIVPYENFTIKSFFLSNLLVLRGINFVNPLLTPRKKLKTKSLKKIKIWEIQIQVGELCRL